MPSVQEAVVVFKYCAERDGTPVGWSEECCLIADKLYTGFQKMSREVSHLERQTVG